MKLRISSDLQLPREAQTSTFVVYGGKGMGKTNALAVFAEELARASLRFSVLDPVGASWGLQHGATKDRSGLPVLILGGLHGDIPIEPTAGAVVADLVTDEAVSTVVDISRHPNGKMWSNGEQIRFVASYAERLYERQGEQRVPIMQIIDECGRFVPQQIPHGAPDIARCAGAIERLVEWGRNVGVGVCLVTQRSARMNKSVSELADCMIAFRTVGPRSVDAILDWLGEHIEKARHKTLLENLRSLDIGTALVVSPGWLKFEGMARIRARETFDSSKTPTPGKRAATPGKAAKPDLAKYQERMAATIERAKADDPKELRKQIAELKKQLAAPQKAKVADSSPVHTAEIAKLRTRVAELEQELTATEAARARLDKAGHMLVESIQGWMEKAQVLLAPPGLAKSAAKTKPVKMPIARAVALAPAKLARTPAGNGVAMGRGERDILIATAQYEGGATREQLTILTGFKRSTRDAYIQRLSVKGYVETKGNVQATEAGIVALGDDYEPLPTGAALLRHWLGKLPAGERKVLEAAIDAYPSVAARDAISEATGFKRSTRDAYIQRLGVRKLVKAERDGVVASEELFG